MKPDISSLAPLMAALVFAGSLTAGAAAAGNLYQEQIHADSFDNLVIYSPGGYKRIVVGQGYLAEALAAAQAEVARSHDDYAPRYRERRYRDHCNRQPVLLHGRSHMYGLPDNVVPVPAGICR
jgi:hypothetical protein